VKGGNIKVESVDDFVNILDEYQKETKRRYSSHFVQKSLGRNDDIDSAYFVEYLERANKVDA
jgi:hypothetical protein